jgi:nucleoside-diphosphate-sugar epimerase
MMMLNRRQSIGLIGTTATLVAAAGTGALAERNLTGKKLIITGHLGNIGARMVPYYEKKGLVVVGIDKKDGASRDLSEPADRSNWRLDLPGADTILHLAGVHDVSQAEVNRNNILATRNLLEAATATGVKRIVFSSSCWVQPSFYRDDNNSLLPDRPYGWGKVEQERMVTHWVLDDFTRQAFIIRIGWAPPEGYPHPADWTDRLYNTTDELIGYFDHSIYHKPSARYYCVDMVSERR